MTTAALAALAFTIWLFDLPSILIRGFDFTPDYGGAVVFAHRVIIPAVVLDGRHADQQSCGRYHI
jgi:hypothetical protein